MMTFKYYGVSSSIPVLLHGLLGVWSMLTATFGALLALPHVLLIMTLISFDMLGQHTASATFHAQASTPEQ